MTTKHLSFILAMLVVTGSARHAAAQDSPDRAAVLATTQRFFDAMRTRDTVLLAQVFDSTARLISVGSRTGPPTMGVTTAAQFRSAITRPGETLNERMFDPEIRVDGGVAQVWTYYTFHRGSTFSHCGVDAFLLARNAGEWKITQVSYSVRTTGCTHTEFP